MPGPVRRPGSRSVRPRVQEDAERGRLLAAAEELVDERGAPGTGLAAICDSAGISRSGFYRSFANRTDCLAALFDLFADRLTAAVADAYRGENDWLGGIRAALAALLSALEASPGLARFLVIDSLTAAAPVRSRRARLVSAAASALRASAGPSLVEPPPGPLDAETVVGAVAAVLHSRLLDDQPRLRELSPPLMGLIVLPHLGAEAARTELERGQSAG
jgi:AcrR family transcriptional regulator